MHYGIEPFVRNPLFGIALSCRCGCEYIILYEFKNHLELLVSACKGIHTYIHTYTFSSNNSSYVRMYICRLPPSFGRIPSI